MAAMRQDSVEGLELTEKIVLTRTRAPDLDSVRKLNCWASNISDVSVVRRIPNLEVCSLSINRITSLRDFAHCHKLKELYVRTNKISCLGDIHYLKNLSRLRSLWLSENPCADTEGYRLIVLRTLPHLQKLDNTAVTPEEVQEALNLEEISVPQDFSASSLFHPGITDSSVSSLSSIDSRFHMHRESTDTSVSTECLPIARKKREQRRLKKAKEDSARKSSEEESPRTGEESEKSSSGELKKNLKEKTDSASDDVCSEDDFKRTLEIDEKEDEGDKGNVSQENGNLTKGSPSAEVKGHSKSSNQTSLSNHISDGSSMSDSQDSCSSRVSDNNADDDGGGGGCCGEEDGNHGDNYKEEERENNVTDDKKGNGSNSNVNDADCMNKSNGNDRGVEEKESKMSSDSLLDKIRLNDSLALDEVPDVHDSIELDDLIIEVDGEKQSGSNTDNDKNNNRNSTDEEHSSTEQVQKDHGKPEEVSSRTSTSPTLMNRCVSPPNAAATSLKTRTTDLAGAHNMGNNKDERLSKMESVDWDEYNRMRQDLGMRPMEKVAASKTVNFDITRVRNANILQAVLSLVKELDKDSLDLVSTAVKARRDNL